jgi:hypothetical protein
MIGAAFGVKVALVVAVTATTATVGVAASRPSGPPSHPGTAPGTSSEKHPEHGKHAEHRGRGVGPDATGPAAFGLCNAWQHSHTHGNSMDHSVAMRNLTRAAGGAGRIGSYCATVPHPGASPTR